MDGVGNLHRDAGLLLILDPVDHVCIYSFYYVIG